VGCQLNSDQALRLICLKGHVRVRDSTRDDTVDKKRVNSCVLKYFLFGGSLATKKKSPQNPEILSQMRY